MDTKPLTFRKNLISKIDVYRKSMLRNTLRRAGIIKVRDHWVYTGNLRSGNIVIDLGANKGLFSKAMHESYGSCCYAVEPNPELYDGIDYEFITKLNSAVTSSNGPVDFYISDNAEASSIIKDFGEKWGSNTKVSIEGLTFNDLIDRLDLRGKEIDVLKVDIEGAELDLIECLKDQDMQMIKQITVEFHDWLNKDLHDRTVQAIKKLKSMGFVAYTDTPNHRWPYEMLFLNRRLINLSTRQKFFLMIFRKMIVLIYRPYYHKS